MYICIYTYIYIYIYVTYIYIYIEREREIYIYIYTIIIGWANNRFNNLRLKTTLEIKKMFQMGMGNR